MALNTKSKKVGDPPQQVMGFLSALELKVFHTAISNYKIRGEFLKEDAIALHWIFGPSIMQVLELVDNDAVTVMKSSTSAKVLIQVYGKGGGEVYWIPQGGCVCQCIGYLRGRKDYCKHILAAHILLAIQNPEEYEEIAESEIISIFNNVISKKKKK